MLLNNNFLQMTKKISYKHQILLISLIHSSNNLAIVYIILELGLPMEITK